MSEFELRRALLNLDATNLAGVPDARQLTWQVLERDRLRVRRLSALALLVWFLAGLLIVGGLINYGFTFPQQAKLVQDVEAGKLLPSERDAAQRAVLMAFEKGTLLIGLSVAVMAFAALVTVMLVVVSRRATLRQVNASLLEISEQVKELRQALTARGPG
jgi:hypothetical protein